MIWRTTALCILLAAGGGSALFFVTDEVRERERVYAQLQHKIVATREATHVLRAEWAYLNRLERIREVSATHLKLGPVGPERIVRLEDLPKRPAPAEERIAENQVPATQPRLAAHLDIGSRR